MSMRTEASEVEQLRGQIAARDKTIAALAARVEGKMAQGVSAFMLLEQNIALDQVVSRKTAELQAALSALQSTQVKLLEAHKLEAVGQLAAGIAHEINTPIQFVTDNTLFLRSAVERLMKALDRLQETIHEHAPAQDEAVAGVLRGLKVDYLRREAPRALAQSLEGLGRVASIVGAMKEFCHPSAGTKEAVDLRESIETAVTLARNEWKYVAEVETEVAADMPVVPCLRNEVNQVLLNLIVNAAHSIGDRKRAEPELAGRIVLRARAEGEWAVLEVADNGAGIRAEIRSRIFEPFFTTKEVGKGTGQGLAIAYSTVKDKHGGTIEVESAEGAGATFTVRLPLSPAGKS